MERREFLKTSCALSFALGAGLVTGGLSSCSTAPIYETTVNANTIRVSIALFTEHAIHIIRAKDLGYDIGVERHPDGSFTALMLRCTHADNQLSVTGGGYFCPLHGSAFDKQGSVTHGPAQRALQRLTTRVSATEIVIVLAE